MLAPMILAVRRATKVGEPMFAVHRAGCRDLAREQRLHDAALLPFVWDKQSASLAEAVRERVYPGDDEVSIRLAHIQVYPCT